MTASNTDTLLSVQNLDVRFTLAGGLFAPVRVLPAVSNVSLDVHRGEVLAVVGESGCGKTTLAKALMGLQTPTSGQVLFDGRPIAGLGRRGIARLMQPIFQDPYSSLNPRKTIAGIIALPLIVHGTGTAAERDALVREMMDKVGLPHRLVHAYPSQLSGGQRQRVAIARALVMRPPLVVCDEPTSALDVSVQAQILNLLLDLRREFDLTLIFISHNLAVVRHMADRVAVMYLGRIVELGPATEVFSEGRHPYTRLLLSSVLVPDPDRRLPEVAHEAELPDPTAAPRGCPFHPRCDRAMSHCASEIPRPHRIGRTDVACHLYGEYQEEAEHA